MEILLEIGLIITVTILFAAIMRMLRQPLIIGYILTGIVIGPQFFNMISATETIEIFSHMGIALLLFIVGLSLNPKVIREVGKVSLLTGVGQVIFTSLVGFFISYSLGFSFIVSIYIAIALSFSSTIIIMKLLSDKGDIETLYGKIAIGFLIVQDLIAVTILMVISSISGGLDYSNLFWGTFLKGFFMLALIFVIGIYTLPSITKVIAKSQEFLLLFSIGWCLSIASLFHYLNFSMEIGALLAGITLSSSPYRHEISAKMKPLRDFFIVLFFILLGFQMGFADIRQYLAPVMIFSFFVLIGNPIIVMTLMGILGYTKRTGFLAGLTVAQISEFSFVLIALGTKFGHLPRSAIAIITAVGLITIAGSTYMIIYSNKIYPYVSKYLSLFEKKGKKIDEHKYHKDEEYDTILFGCDLIGYDVLESLKKTKKKFLVIDYNPERIIGLAKKGIECRYADAGDSDLLNELNFSKTNRVISTIPDINTNLLLINKIKESNRKAIIIVVSHQIDEAMELYKRGATYVIMPHYLGKRHASTLIEKYGLDISKFLKEKIAHIEHLKKRKHDGA
ncbi:cation:proton antiporter [Candidatus Woesearchaeota archaeon]|nr:cation:proton antiporter [Candidatus Woesearchaeota archaeon]